MIARLPQCYKLRAVPAANKSSNFVNNSTNIITDNPRAKMSRSSILLLLLLALSSCMGSTQSCVRKEVAAVFSDLANQLEGITEGQCGRENIDQELNETMHKGFQNIAALITKETQHLKQMIRAQPGYEHPNCPGIQPIQSCKEQFEDDPSSPSGHYWVQSTPDHITRVYCEMNKTCKGVTGGWMRVTDIDMTNTTHFCPEGLRTLTDPKRLCSMSINGGGCSSAMLDTKGVQYSKVCGKIIGYQQRAPDAFRQYYDNRALTIDDVYVDGISLTYGEHPRKHIWTFAAALHEVLSSHREKLCPCTNIHNPVTIPIPPYVGNDYFCDTASSDAAQYRFYPGDPLWDGKGCGSLNTCCTLNNPPWFMKQLLSLTRENIEMRLCADQNRENEDIVFETMELYVQ